MPENNLRRDRQGATPATSNHLLPVGDVGIAAPPSEEFDRVEISRIVHSGVLTMFTVEVYLRKGVLWCLWLSRFLRRRATHFRAIEIV